MKNIPDRIYLDIRGFENVDMSFSEVRQRFGVPYYEHSMSNNDVEYVRTDAFIEKACKYWYQYNRDIVKRHGAKAVLGCSEFTVNVEDFRNYMKGEQL